MQHELEQRFRPLELYITRACAARVPEEFAPELLKFGTVLICGAIEQCVQIVVLHRLQARAHPKVLNFIKSYFRKGINLDCSAISQLLARFDANWSQTFDQFAADNDDVKEGISSVYGIRNSVAHGGSSSVGSKRLKELFDASKRLIEGVVAATR